MKLLKKCTKILSSSRLALFLIILLILFAVIGATVPQEGGFSTDELALWQNQHLFLTELYKPVGFFHVFTSVPFLILIITLFVNTLTCTVLYYYKIGGIQAFKGAQKIQYTGFFMLHFSLLVIFTAGIISTATKLDGLIVLTEGQSVVESQNGYIELAEGVFRKKQHSEFTVQLESVNIKHFDDMRRKEVSCVLNFKENKQTTSKGVVSINNPFNYKGFDFTQDETGFSPKIKISYKNGKTLVHSFIALKTFKDKGQRIYRDFLPLPVFKDNVIINFFPDYKIEEGKLLKTHEELINPCIFVQFYNENGDVTEKTLIRLHETGEIGNFQFEFSDIRQWSSFRVMEDKGYIIAVYGLWLAVAALVLRYFKDLVYLFKIEDKHTGGK